MLSSRIPPESFGIFFKIRKSDFFDVKYEDYH